MTEWEPIGKVWVDSGQILITDPCYVLDKKEYKKRPVLKYLTVNHGLLTSGWGGDGNFPIFVKKNKDGLILEMKIILDRNNPLYGVEVTEQPTKVYNKDEEVQHD